MKYKVKIIEVTDIFSNTSSKLIKEGISKGEKVYGIKLENLKGLIGFEVGPNRRIGTELADVAKRFGLKGILHSDELPKYGISEKEVNRVKEKLECKDNDAFIIILTKDYEKAKIVFSSIVERINEMIKKVPKDTRQANEDGTTSFLRPQPGAARMYPETDHPLIFIDKKVEEYEKYRKIIYNVRYGDKNEIYEFYKLKDENDFQTFLELFKENKDILDSLNPEFIKNLLKYLGFNDKQIEDIIWSEYLRDIILLSTEVNSDIVYYLFYQLLGDTASLFKEKIEYLDLDFIYKIVKYIRENKITRNAIPILYYYYTKEKKDIEEIIKKEGLEKRNYDQLRKEIEEFIKSVNEKDKKRIYSLVFNKFKYIGDSQDIKKILDEILNK